MSLKENLLKKIKIDELARQIITSLKPVDGISRVDKNAMKHILEMGPYAYQHERDLDLYIKTDDSEKKMILVLDNDLPVYHTTIEDVALRKSPTIKEMISITNAFKILNDSDVLLSKKEASLHTILNECIDALDLAFNESDIESIANDGAVALERENPEGILECLSLFAELLDYRPPPKIMDLENNEIIGALVKTENNQPFFGPMIIYNAVRYRVKFIDKVCNLMDKAQNEFIHKVAIGKEEAPAEGPAVFQCLKNEVLQRKTKNED